MYELLGICLVLAALLTINALASLATAAIWRLLEQSVPSWSPRARVDVLFGLRVSPPVLAVIAVSLFLVPSYLNYEPYATPEVVSKKLASLALVSGLGVMFALWRCARSWWATHSLLREWLVNAYRIRLEGIDIPTFRLPHAFPIIAVVGTVRPRLFIAERVMQSLTEEELAAAIAHERGHLAARDNFKRLLLRMCRDLLMIVPCGRALDRAWAEAAESAADEHAAQQNGDTALNLAAALIKIAKMIPAGSRAAMPVAAFLVGGEENRGVKSRVRRLVDISSNGSAARVHHNATTRIGLVLSLAVVIVFCAAVANSPHVLITVHALIEHAVKLLS
jgi:Zn-dependent protease with chaperone function